jgi:hypothetical protein
MSARIRAHLRSNVVGYIALFLVLTGGSAYALDGSDTVFSDDIVNGEVHTGDLGGGAVNSAKVADGTITGNDVGDQQLSGRDISDDSVLGSDVNESTFGQVPDSAAVGGKSLSEIENDGGGSFNANLCDPNLGFGFIPCGTRTTTLPANTNVLLNASGGWFGSDVSPSNSDPDKEDRGVCELQKSGPSNTEVALSDVLRLGQLLDNHGGQVSASGFSLTGVTTTDVDSSSFKVACKETNSDFKVQDVSLTYVVLSRP